MGTNIILKKPHKHHHIPHYNSIAIKGNTLTLMETKLVLADGISVVVKSLSEIYESVNHQKAYGYVKNFVEKAVQRTGCEATEAIKKSKASDAIRTSDAFA